MVGPAFLIRSRQMPASLGVQGPGESTMAFGFLSRTSSAEILSLRITTLSVTKLAQVVDEIVGKAVVVIDQDEHIANNPGFRGFSATGAGRTPPF